MALIFKNHPFRSVFLLVTLYVTLGLKANAQGAAPVPGAPAAGVDPAAANGAAPVPGAPAAGADPAAANGAAPTPDGMTDIMPPAPAGSPAALYCDPQGDTVFCGQIIGNAKSWEEAMTATLNKALEELAKGNAALDGLEHKIDAAVDPEKKMNIVNVCSDGFDTVMASLKEAQALVTNDPTLALNNKVSAAFGGFSECIDVLTDEENQKGEIGQLIGLNVIIQQHVYICLMVSNRDPRVQNYYKKLEQGGDDD